MSLWTLMYLIRFAIKQPEVFFYEFLNQEDCIRPWSNAMHRIGLSFHRCLPKLRTQDHMTFVSMLISELDMNLCFSKRVT